MEDKMKKKFFKEICLPSWIKWVLLGLLLFLLIFPLTPVVILGAGGSIYLLPLLPIIWIVCGFYFASLMKDKFKYIRHILFISIFVSIAIIFFAFKLGIFWLSWFLTISLSIFSIFLIVKYWKTLKKKSILKVLFGIFAIALFLTLFYPLNPFVSMFGFFGTGKVIALNNPCENCQREKWECDLLICNEGIINSCPEGVCENLKNIKNCYCCECIENFKYCPDCFLFWNNSYRCDAFTGKCAVGW